MLKLRNIRYQNLTKKIYYRQTRSNVKKAHKLIFMSITILNRMAINIIGLPIAVIDLITGIYAVIGMFNALSNITGNGICTSIVAYQYNSFDMDTFNEKNKPEKT